MTTQKEIELKNRISTYGNIEITIVDNNGNVKNEEFTDFNEAKDVILLYENENTVYF